MKLFSRLYDQALIWSKHPKAVRLLWALGICESIFFPVPTDVMLAPMALANPDRAWRFASIASLSSVIGGVLGFALGYFLFDSFLEPNLVDWGYLETYNRVSSWFSEYGIWVVFIAGFSPIPYKVFTLTAGALHMALMPFIVISLISRGARFYLVAGLMKWGGESMREKLRLYVDRIGWGLVLIILIYLVYWYFK